MPEHDVLIVGGGLAGLACGLELHAGGARPLILEAGDGVGGRVRTDVQDGFRMDRGFQVLLEAYPECRRILDYEALELKAFYPGATIWTGKDFTRFSDPYRRPQDVMATLASPLGSFSDKLRVTRLRKEVRQGPPRDLLAGPDVTTKEDLEAMGFSSGMIQGFFRPFFGGVLLSPDLSDSSRIFRYIFRMFSEGDISVPARGMGEIPLQMADRLPEASIRLHARVDSVTPGGVRLDSGEEIQADVLVLATEGPEAARLFPGIRVPGSKGATCLYFQAPEPPLEGPILVLDGSGSGPVNNLAVMSQISADYAPPGQNLVAVGCIGLPSGSPEETEAAVRRQLKDWFGGAVEEWRLLRSYRIPHAQPGQPPGVLEPAERPVRLGPGRFVCGDHRETASLQGAIHSGRRAAREVLAEQGTGAVD
ncbi:MAG: NAD(P)/FAD-dependent oxidoreductase [Longimicrobiales bacterium]